MINILNTLLIAGIITVGGIIWAELNSSYD